MRSLYIVLTISALAAAVFGTVVFICIPQTRFASFVLHVLANYAFAVGAYGRVRMLAAAQLHRASPIWNKIAFHAIGFGVIAMAFSLLTFFGN